MTLAEFEASLKRQRLADREVCTCGHEREAHQDRCAGCHACQCFSFRFAKEAS